MSFRDILEDLLARAIKLLGPALIEMVLNWIRSLTEKEVKEVAKEVADKVADTKVA